MTRVKIRNPNSKDPNIKQELLEVLSRNEVYISRLIPIADGFVITTSSEADLDQIFNGVTDKILEDKGFQPMIPPELKANRSVIVFGVDSHIYNHELNEIILEIKNKNRWTKNEVSEVYKFPNSKTLKITFTQSKVANKALTTGLLLFSMSISPHQMKQEVFLSYTDLHDLLWN